MFNKQRKNKIWKMKIKLACNDFDIVFKCGKDNTRPPDIF